MIETFYENVDHLCLSVLCSVKQQSRIPLLSSKECWGQWTCISKYSFVFEPSIQTEASWHSRKLLLCYLSFSML